MKNKSSYIAIAYWILAMALVLFLSGCKTKKSTTDFKQTETENVSTLISENKEQKSLITEKEQKRETKSVTDKSLFETNTTITADELIVTDVNGNTLNFKNAQINQRSSQTNDIAKTEQTDSNSNKVATRDENRQNDVKVNANKKTKTDLQETNKVKGREPVWLYVVGAIFALIIITAGYYTLKKQFGYLLSKKK